MHVFHMQNASKIFYYIERLVVERNCQKIKMSCYTLIRSSHVDPNYIYFINNVMYVLCVCVCIYKITVLEHSELSAFFIYCLLYFLRFCEYNRITHEVMKTIFLNKAVRLNTRSEL